MVKRMIMIVLVVIIVVFCASCDSMDDSSFPYMIKEGEATRNQPGNPYEPHTIKSYEGIFTFRLVQSYTGEDAIEKLKEMGEKDFSEERLHGLAAALSEEKLKYMLLEFEACVEEGYSDGFYCSDVFGNDVWDTELMSKYNYAGLDLRAKAGLNSYFVVLHEGEQAPAFYVILAIPEQVTVFRNVIYSNREYWFEYDLSMNSK